VEATIKTLATKDDIANVKEDIANLRKEMGYDLSNLRKEMGEGNIKLHKEMAESRTENTKWMFIFWIGQVGATLAILMLFLKK